MTVNRGLITGRMRKEMTRISTVVVPALTHAIEWRIAMIYNLTRTALASAMRGSAACAGLLGMAMIPGAVSAQPTSAQSTRGAAAQPIRQGAAPAASANGAPQCGANEICLFEENDYEGTPWRWTRGDGYRDLPPYLHDDVGSFIANVAGCFIDWKVPGSKGEFRKVPSGSYSAAYGDKFGGRIDALQVYSRCR